MGRQFGILKHGLVDGLFVLMVDEMEIYFDYAGYDHSEGRLIFERGDEVVTAKLKVECESQLKEWKNALDNMGIEMEICSE